MYRPMATITDVFALWTSCTTQFLFSLFLDILSNFDCKEEINTPFNRVKLTKENAPHEYAYAVKLHTTLIVRAEVCNKQPLLSEVIYYTLPKFPKNPVSRNIPVNFHQKQQTFTKILLVSQPGCQDFIINFGI